MLSCTNLSEDHFLIQSLYKRYGFAVGSCTHPHGTIMLALDIDRESPYVQVLGGLVLASALYLLYAVRRASASRRSLPLPPGPDDKWYTPGPKYVVPIIAWQVTDTRGSELR